MDLKEKRCVASWHINGFFCDKNNDDVDNDNDDDVVVVEKDEK